MPTSRSAVPPTITATPAIPTRTPVIRPPLIFSSVVSQWASSVVTSGVVAFRMAATPLAMWVWPQEISAKGTALLSIPMTRKAAHTDPSRGSRWP